MDDFSFSNFQVDLFGGTSGMALSLLSNLYIFLVG
jgi:hypothetical protein